MAQEGSAEGQPAHNVPPLGLHIGPGIGADWGLGFQSRQGRGFGAADFQAVLTVMTEFNSRTWAAIEIPPPPDSASEAAELTPLMEQRPERMEEIVAQNTSVLDYYTALLGITAYRYSDTYLLMRMSIPIADLTAAYFKNKFNRPRPSHFRPALMPPIPVPGTPSYPSGHGVQAFLIALVLMDVVPQFLEPAVASLSERIAQNRLIAGLNYPSDVSAARDLARKVHSLLKECATFEATHRRALSEWPDLGVQIEPRSRPEFRQPEDNEEPGSTARQAKAEPEQAKAPALEQVDQTRQIFRELRAAFGLDNDRDVIRRAIALSHLVAGYTIETSDGRVVRILTGNASGGQQREPNFVEIILNA